MPAGRPTKLDKKMLERAVEFLDGGWKDGVAVYPGITGMAIYLNLFRDTVVDWENHPEKSDLHKKFSCVVKAVRDLKRYYISQKGLKGELQPRICGILLSQVGIVEKKELNTKGEIEVKGELTLPDPIREILENVKSS